MNDPITKLGSEDILIHRVLEPIQPSLDTHADIPSRRLSMRLDDNLFMLAALHSLFDEIEARLLQLPLISSK